MHVEESPVGGATCQRLDVFMYRVRKEGRIHFDVRVLSDQVHEKRARMLPNDVRNTNENRQSRNCDGGDLVLLLTHCSLPKLEGYSWSGVGRSECHGW